EGARADRVGLVDQLVALFGGAGEAGEGAVAAFQAEPEVAFGQRAAEDPGASGAGARVGPGAGAAGADPAGGRLEHLGGELGAAFGVQGEAFQPAGGVEEIALAYPGHLVRRGLDLDGGDLGGDVVAGVYS